MRLIVTQLKKVLMDKIETLLDLIQGQNQMKDFLEKPVWDEYFKILIPQKELLKKLRDNVSEQQSLSRKLAQHFGLEMNTPLLTLLPLLNPEDRDVLVPLFDASRLQAERLKSLSQMSDRLMKAQNEFTANWVESWQERKVGSISLYNSFGYQIQKPTISVFHQDA